MVQNAAVARAHEPDEAGVYLSDGRALYRVVAPLQWAEHCKFALLEDCVTLEVFACTADQLFEAALEVVVPDASSDRPGVSLGGLIPGRRAKLPATGEVGAGPRGPR